MAFSIGVRYEADGSEKGEGKVEKDLDIQIWPLNIKSNVSILNDNISPGP